ncbi:MAG: Multidrug resistance protein MdtE [Desulfovibrio sp.]
MSVFFQNTGRSGLTALAAFLVLWVSSCQNDPASTAAQSLPKVVVVAATTITTPSSYTFNGTLAASETVEVRPRISGYLAEKKFADGGQVTQGQVLFVLDDRDLKAALKTAKAQTARAKATWVNADTVRNRMSTLVPSGAVSRAEYDQAIATANESKSTYDAALAEEERAAVNLSYATITAPISGYISRSNVEVGGTVEVGSSLPMVTVYNINPLRAEFSVSDREYTQFKWQMAKQGKPDAVEFRITLSEGRFVYPHPGTLEMADPIINERTKTIGVRVLFPNPGHDLLPGMFVNVTASAGEAETVVVPEVAVFDQVANKAVYTVDKDDVLRLKQVTLGRLLGEQREILSGLKPGELVVTEGLVNAMDGLKAQVERR